MRREQLYAAYGADAISLAGNARARGARRTANPGLLVGILAGAALPGQRGRAHDNRDAGRSSCASYECSAPPSSHPIGAAATFLALAVLLAAVVGYDFQLRVPRDGSPASASVRPAASGSSASPIEREFEEASACEGGHEAASA